MDCCNVVVKESSQLYIMTLSNSVHCQLNVYAVDNMVNIYYIIVHHR